jgi:hypothetical protein
VKLALAITLTAAAVLARLAPHLPNATPIAAVALFSGVYLTDRLAWLVPLIALLATDAVLGWYDWPVMLSVYSSFALIGLIGQRLSARPTTGRIAAASLAGSCLFFVVTNAAVWAWGHLYPPTLAGLAASYVNALPFFRNTLLGDLGYTAILFGSYALVVRLVARRVPQPLSVSV